VELGVNLITPLITERCQVQFKGEKKSQRWIHWQKIVQHATEQSGRTQLPELLEIDRLSAWVSQQQGLKVFLDPYAEQCLSDLERPTQVALLVGPEGGFSDAEREIAKESGFIPVRMGARILRTETAALAALSAVQMLWGDFGVGLSNDQ
jgi:16S rRNA (uracil1498-N3)-methyltransferase